MFKVNNKICGFGLFKIKLLRKIAKSNIMVWGTLELKKKLSEDCTGNIVGAAFINQVLGPVIVDEKH